ncbi:MAG: hypothetical protein IJB01_10305 [Bacteroidaceae bacterium]|nr:hypothetical protein [Bacteroidaceae bacterium]
MKKFTLLIASLFITIGAMAQDAAKTIVGVNNVPTTKVDLSQGLESGYYLLKQTNSNASSAGGQGVGYIKAANEAADGSVTSKNTGTPNGATFVWYVEVVDATNNLITISTANKVAAWQAPVTGQKNLVAYDSRATLKYHTGTVNIDRDATPNEGSCFISNEGVTAFVHFSGDNLGSWTDTNSASMFMVEFYKLEETDLVTEAGRKISDFYEVTTTFGTYEGTTSNIVNGNTGDKWWSDEAQAVDKNITVVLNNVHQVGTIRWYFCDNDKPNGATIERKATADGDWIPVADFTIDDIENNVFTCTADGNDVKELRLRITTANSNWLQVAEVELYESVDKPVHEVIYNYVENDVVVGTMTYNVAEGSAYPDVVSGLYGVTVTGSKPDGNVTASGTHEIAVEIGEMPFEYASTYAEIGNKWCNLVMHSNEGNGSSRYRTYVGAGDATTLAWGTHRSLTNAGDEYYWAFVGNPINGFRVVNKAKGENYILSSNGSTNPVMLEEATLADDYNTTWQIADRTTNNGNDWVEAGDWFCLKYRANWYMNANAGAQEAHVNFWNSDDNGSGILAVKPLTIDADADVATYFAETSFVIPETLGAEVYYVNNVENGYAKFEQITGTVYQETGVVVKFDTEADVTYAPEFVSPGTTTAVEGNLLKGTTKRTLISKDANKSYYVLGMTDGVGFYNAVNGENKGEFYNGAFKAYLELPAAQGTAAFYGFDWNGTTGISEVKGESGNVKAIYDLTGRKVENITAPGIYVVNGKKVLVK